MAQKAFMWSHEPPTYNSGNFRFTVLVSYIDPAVPEQYHDSNGLVVDVSPSLLTSIRAQLRDAVKDNRPSGWTLSNDDVYFIDGSRELV